MSEDYYWAGWPGEEHQYVLIMSDLDLLCY